MSSRNSSASSYPSRSSKSHDDLVNEVVATSLGTDKQSAILIKYILMAIGALAVLKILSQSLLYLSIVASPFLYAYLKGTCPSTNTFDAKEELKPVLEGRHLPPQQQATKSSWEKMLNSARASVTAEYSALMGDTRTEFTPIFGVAVLAKVTCQQQTYYWIGARNEWKFLYTNGINVSSTTTSTNRRASSISTSSNNETFRESMTRKSTIAAAAAVAALSSSTASRADDSKKSL